MGQMSNYAAATDAQIRQREEECALGMEQSRNDAASKDAQLEPRREVFALNMEHIAILSTNPLHFLYHEDQHMMTRQQLFPIIPLPRLLPSKSRVEILLA